MPGTKISTTIDNSITLGTAGYTGPISITSTGAIEPVQYGATALTIPAAAAHGTVTNHGLIIGGAGYGIGANAYIKAGDGMSVTQGTVINDGTIEAGHAGPNNYGAFGASGILLGGGSVTNNGLIIGGNGGAREPEGYGVKYGQGGSGITIDAAHSTLVNKGTIDGGAGGLGAGYGGIGVSVSSAASIVNSGLIAGGKGGADTSSSNDYHSLSGDGGDGFQTKSGTRLINRGTIIGGAGGHGVKATGKNPVHGGDGGAGVSTNEAQNGNYILNQGKIIGGDGGKGAGGGGAGVDLAGTGSLANEGLIKGGTGGAAGYSQVNGGVGGIGISVETTGVNYGIILGGNGGSGGATGVSGRGGEGGDFAFGRFTNDGLIQGGAGTAGFGAGYGASLYNETMINNGVIAAGQSGGTDNGVMGVYLQASTLINHGIINGGGAGAAKAPYDEDGGTGGTGLSERRGYALNTGSILGGGGSNAAKGAAYFAGNGGIGVAISGYGGGYYNDGSLVNTGTILAGAGGPANSDNLLGGRGGIGVTLSNGSFDNSGAILGGAGGASAHPGGRGGAGGDGVYLGGYGVAAYEGFTNSGLIRGGAGGYGVTQGGFGGIGVYVSETDTTGSFSNTGTILGGDGGDYGPSRLATPFGGTGLSLNGGTFSNGGEISGGGGGQGVYLTGEAVLSNAKDGLIQGGYIAGAYRGASGVYIRGEGGFANAGQIVGGAVEYQHNAKQPDELGQGGTGVTLQYLSTGSNSGSITGGSAGSLGVNIQGVAGGTGLYMFTYITGYNPNTPNTTFFNSGQITGGAGGAGTKYGGAGGDGVYLSYGTLTDSGTITGGAGGYGKMGGGANGDAIRLGVHATLIVENGAVFNGLVLAEGGTGKAADTLELSGTSSTPLTDIGTQITGFHDIEFAANAAWTLAGGTTGLTSGQQITGFTSSDAIELTNAAAAQGQVHVHTAGVVTITAGGDNYELDIKGATVGESFTFSDYTLRESVMSPAPAMMFLRPAEPASASPSFFNALGLEQFMSAPAFHMRPLSGTEPAAWANHASLTAGSQLGLFQDISKPPQGDVQTLVTLHA
jgi:hypothetical protein